MLVRPGRRAEIAAATGSAILVFVALFSLAAMQGLIPLFFIQGVGPTVLRQVILENAVAFFALSSVLFMFTYLKGRSDFFFWNVVSFALISIGLLAVFFQPSVGSLIGWVGRSAQYLGFVYALCAVLVARRAAAAKGLPFEEAIANFFVDAEQSYKQLVETANDAIVTFDDNDRILLWNAAAERMFGYTRDEAVGSSFPELAIDDRYSAVIKSEDEDIPVGGQHTRVLKPIEISGKRKDGTLLPVELTISRRWQDGRLIRTGILRDLTGRKRLESELRAANEGLEAKVQERTAEIKRKTESLRRAHEELSASYEQFTAAEEELRQQYSALSEKDEAIRILNRDLEKRVEERTRELQQVNEELISSKEELRRQLDLLAERGRQLAESEERFRLIAQSVSDVIWDWNIPDRRVDWYGRIDEILGYAPGEFPRTLDAWQQIIHPDDRDRVTSVLDMHVKTQTPYSAEYRVIRKDGEIRYWTDKGTAMLDENGTT
ncbi:MAG: PAS domain S-box protein, partial [Methanoregula sp.]|nr:PAS domain S-box protein [Methanoregula sp.]